jgi:hypothetical protein
MSCEHEWKIEDLTSWSDEGYPYFWVELALVCSKCQATAAVDYSFNYSGDVRDIEGDEEE